MDQNNQDNYGCCCPAFVEENDYLKKMKPILVGGLIIYCILLILDMYFVGGTLAFDYLILMICLSFMIFNRCYIAFHYYTFISVLVVFSYCIPVVGVIIQNKFGLPNSVLIFCFYLFIIIFSVVFFYICFLAYKEMKYLFVNRTGSSPQLAGFTAPYTQGDRNYGNNNYNYNYNSNNSNNSNQNNNKGFKAFSGKGYAVGGS